MTTNDEDNYNTFVIKWKDSLKSFLNDPVDTRSFCISQHGAGSLDNMRSSLHLRCS